MRNCYGVITFLGLLFFLSCATNPMTGKKTLNLVSNSELFPASFQQYGQFLKENKVIQGTADAKRVENIGIKIKEAAEKYLINFLKTKGEEINFVNLLDYIHKFY